MRNTNMYRYASLGICSLRCGFSLIARRSLSLSLPFSSLLATTTRVKGNTRGVGIPMNLIPDIFPFFHFFYLSFARILVFCTLAFSCSYMRTNYALRYVAYFLPYIFLRAWTLYAAHFPLCIPFDTFFSLSHGYRVLHMFPLTYSLSLYLPFSLFTPLFLFVSCFVRALFYAGRCVYLSCPMSSRFFRRRCPATHFHYRILDSSSFAVVRVIRGCRIRMWSVTTSSINRVSLEITEIA